MESEMPQTLTQISAMEINKPLLNITNLEIEFKLRHGTVKAVNGLSLQIKKGKVLGLVGESGSGKSVSARSVLRIEAPGIITGGSINYYPKNGEALPIHNIDPRSFLIRSLRWNEIAMVFQEPMTSFGPMHTIGNQISEVLMLHKELSKKDAREQAVEHLRSVGLPRPDKAVNQYPHQLSGGMLQRAMIAMALSCRPSLLIADEPTSALDVSTEAQILEVLNEKQKGSHTSILYISHNLEIIAAIADEVAVMYLGNILEYAPADELFKQPKHPYTIDLLLSVPQIDQDFTGKKLNELRGNIPDPYHHPSGCKYHTRCKKYIEGVCDTVTPQLLKLSEKVKVACHLYTESHTMQHEGSAE